MKKSFDLVVAAIIILFSAAVYFDVPGKLMHLLAWLQTLGVR